MQKVRASDDTLKRFWLWTADFWPATNVDGSIVKYNLADGPFNLIFRNKETAIPEILLNGFYRCNPEEMKDVFNNSEEILSNDIKFTGDIKFTDSDYYAYFGVDTSKPQNLSAKNLVMAQRVHGRTLDDYLNTMKLLKDNNVKDIKTINIYFLNPEYVLKNTVPGESIARVSALDSFNNNGRFPLTRFRSLLGYLILWIFQSSIFPFRMRRFIKIIVHLESSFARCGRTEKLKEPILSRNKTLR